MQSHYIHPRCLHFTGGRPLSLILLEHVIPVHLSRESLRWRTLSRSIYQQSLSVCWRTLSWSIYQQSLLVYLRILSLSIYQWNLCICWRTLFWSIYSWALFFDGECYPGPFNCSRSFTFPRSLSFVGGCYQGPFIYLSVTRYWRIYHLPFILGVLTTVASYPS